MNTKHLKAKILDLAIRGKLVEQIPHEGNATDLLQKIRNEKTELIKLKKLKEDKKSSFVIKSENGKHYEQFADGCLIDIEDDIPFDIPENWCWCRLKDIGNWQSGCTPDKSRKDFYDKADIPWLNSGDLTDGYIENIPHSVSKIAFDEKKMKLNDAGSVCIAMYGATIGKLGILTKPATTNQAVLVCNKLHLTDPKYLFYFLKSHKKEYIQAGFGGAQPNISKEKVEPTLFPLPPLDEQKRIVFAIEKEFKQIDIIEKNKHNLKTYIKQTKNKVLDLAIRGKLVEQIPHEGNATDLLQKIRNEKTELIKLKKLKEDKKSSFVIKSENGKHYEQFADGCLIDIEDDIPFDIPENWCWCRLKDIGNWQSGCTPDKSRKDFYDKADIPWLNSGDLTDGYIENIPHSVSKIAFDEKKMKLNDAGSVCIAMYGATIGKLGILTKPATTNQAVLVCNKLHLTDPKYLFYFLKSHKKEYIQAGFGGAQPNISKEKVEPTLFPLPPLDEQKRIVERIEQIFEQLDVLEKALGE